MSKLEDYIETKASKNVDVSIENATKEARRVIERIYQGREVDLRPLFNSFIAPSDPTNRGGFDSIKVREFRERIQYLIYVLIEAHDQEVKLQSDSYTWRFAEKYKRIDGANNEFREGQKRMHEQRIMQSMESMIPDEEEQPSKTVVISGKNLEVHEDDCT